MPAAQLLNARAASHADAASAAAPGGNTARVPLPKFSPDHWRNARPRDAGAARSQEFCQRFSGPAQPAVRRIARRVPGRP